MVSPDLIHTIETTYEQLPEIVTGQYPNLLIKSAVKEIIRELDVGQLRVAEKKEGIWQVHQWIKKAILLYFKCTNNQPMEGHFTRFFDKIPSKYVSYDFTELKQSGVRIVPPTFVREGAYIAPSTVLMPSFVNIGAYVDSGAMIDTWSTIGSCAQIGKNVHISGGVGIGGVLEPLQTNPVIIEDNCFIGARSEIAEGVIVEANSVISMGVYLGQSTRIYNRMNGTMSYGRIPTGSVVVPGNLPSEDGKYSLYAAIIVKQVDEKTRGKTSINTLLRDITNDN